MPRSWFRAFLIVAFIFSMVVIRECTSTDQYESAWVKYRLNGEVWWVENSLTDGFELDHPDANTIGFRTSYPDDSDANILQSNSGNSNEGHPPRHSTKEFGNRQKDNDLETQKEGRPPLASLSQLDNGDSPYDQLFGSGVYDRDIHNYIEFKNSNSSDVVIILREVGTDKAFRNEYIRRGETFRMTSIPNGQYYVQYYSGNDWNRNRIKSGDMTGGFNYDESFSRSTMFDLIMLNQIGDTYSTYTITLYEVVDGNFETSEIDDSEFFE